MLIATVVLSFLAALGGSLLLFELVADFPGEDPSYPLFAFIFLVALGVDYNIFLMARVREEALALPTREAMLKGLAVTGGVITSAGIVLAGTFSVLAVLPLVALTQIGITVAFGVLLDTFVVRSILVPALTFELGRARSGGRRRSPRASRRADAACRRKRAAPRQPDARTGTERDGRVPPPPGAPMTPRRSCSASASSRAASASPWSRSAPGSAGTDYSRPAARRGASGSTARTTSRGSSRCAHTSSGGLSAAEAARLALAEELAETTPLPSRCTDAKELDAALDRFDEAAAQRALDRLLATLTLDVVLRDVLMPYLHELGERWEQGEVSVAQEHFASNLVRGPADGPRALMGPWHGPESAPGVRRGRAPRPPAAGLRALAPRARAGGSAISERTRRSPSVVEAARALAPAAVVISGTTSGAFDESAARLREVTLHAPLWIAGAAASGRVARRAHAAHLAGDVVLAAETLAAGVE